MERTRVLVLFGGQSSEHQVSCLSAANVAAAIDRDRYDVVLVGITTDGRWTAVTQVPQADGAELPTVPDDGPTVALIHDRSGARLVAVDADPLAEQAEGGVDVCWPVLHGSYGEDGTVQGLLASFGVPYVGPDVAASAIAIDKLQMKRVFAAVGLPQVPYAAVERTEWEAGRDALLAQTEATLGYPVFTKPSRQGSSVGIRRCTDRTSLAAGIEDALAYDRVALVETAVEGLREIECGITGNTQFEVTAAGETVHTGEFYDFEAKYAAPVKLECPAAIGAPVQAAAQEYAERAFRAIGGRGLARVDLFYQADTDGLWVNEINTLPGMTDQSMFWAVWDAEGLSRPELAGRLLTLALETAAVEQNFPP